jgi:ABC-2 type transport system ATP-binding protein
LNDLIAAGDVADDSRVITGRPVTVAAAFAGELPYLMPPPVEPFDPTRLLEARVDNRARVSVRSATTRSRRGSPAGGYRCACRPPTVEASPPRPRLEGVRDTGLTLTPRQPCTLVPDNTQDERTDVQMTASQIPGLAIHVQGLEKSYNTLQVLRGVDFDVERGSIFALLGSNGAGKTTAVNILSTLLKADAGTATVNDFDVATQAADVRESISLTGQFAAVDEILTGRENLVLVARLRRVKDAGQLADALLARFQLTDAAERRVATYSGGMRRRLDIAMSLIGNPPVIFLDEPTAGLDPQARIEVWHTVKELAGQGTTVLLTTQYLDEAEQLADRIAILHQGRIIANGTLTELKQLLPPAKVEYVEKQPTLEDVFLAIVGDDGTDGHAGTDGNPATTAASAPTRKEQP